MRRSSFIVAACLCTAMPLMVASSCTFTFVTPETATSTETQNVTLPAGASVVVSNPFGTITAEVDEAATQATIRIVRLAYGPTQQDADDLLADMVVTVTEPTAQDNRLVITATDVQGTATDMTSFNMVVNGDDVTITSIFGNTIVASYKIALTLPPGHAVDATQEAGVIRVTGLDTASTLSGSATSIRVNDCVAEVAVETEAGNVDVVSHAGSLTATVSAGSVSLDIASLAAEDEVNAHCGCGIDRNRSAG